MPNRFIQVIGSVSYLWPILSLSFCPAFSYNFLKDREVRLSRAYRSTCINAVPARILRHPVVPWPFILWELVFFSSSIVTLPFWSALAALGKANMQKSAPRSDWPTYRCRAYYRTRMWEFKKKKDLKSCFLLIDKHDFLLFSWSLAWSRSWAHTFFLGLSFS